MRKMIEQTRSTADLIIVWFGGITHYMMQLFEQDPEQLLVFVNIGVGITIILFTLTRIFFWIKNQGSSK